MNKVFFYIMFAVIGLSLQSCLHDDDEVFDTSAANRINEAVANAEKVLTSSQNGWVMHYYTGREYAYGGLNLAMKFNNGKVEMYNETAVNTDGSLMSAVSTYKITRDQGPVLAFDTYNKLLHVYGEPQGGPTDVDGYEADYEFVIMNISADENTIVLQGKKFGNRIVLERLSRPVEEYFAESAKVSTALVDAGILVLNVGDDRAKLYPSEGSFNIKYINDDKEVESMLVPFTSTDKGVLFNEPVVLYGDTIEGINVDIATVDDEVVAQGFKYSNDESKTLSVSKDFSDIFQTGNWYLAQSNMGPVAGPGFKSFVDACLEEENEILTSSYIGTYSGIYGFYFLSAGRYWGVAGFNVDAPLDQPDVITFDLAGYSGNGTYYTNYCNFADAYEPFLTTFKLTPDNADNPTEFTLTDQKNPENVIKLVKEEILTPGSK